MTSRALIAGALCAAMCAAAPTQSALQQGSEAGVRDYYAANTTTDGARALMNLEQHHLAPAISQLTSRNYHNALSEITFILGSFPNHPRLLALLSDLCDVQWKDLRCDSDLWFQRAVQINPKVSQTHVLDGLHKQRRGRAVEAVQAYTRALELNPASSNAHYNLGLAYFDQKRFDLANQHAQASYALGFPLPGLKDKLNRAGQWKALPDDEVKRLTVAPKAEPDKAQ